MVITYRSIKHSDLDDIKMLCEECFPVRYPERWYKSLTASSKYFTLAAINSDKLVGLIVAKIKNKNQCNPEDINILNQGFFRDHKFVYILTLGVTRSCRNQGIASELLNRLLAYVNTKLCRSIKAIYLHVLTTNTNAIYFYEKRGFSYAQMLPDYYSIDEKLFPAFTYILYINGGCPQKCFRDYFQQITSYMGLLVCVIARFVVRCIRHTLGAFHVVAMPERASFDTGMIDSGVDNCLVGLNTATFSKPGYDSSPLRL